MLALHTNTYMLEMDEISFSAFELVYRNSSWDRAFQKDFCYIIPIPIRIDYIDKDEPKKFIDDLAALGKGIVAENIRDYRLLHWGDISSDGSITGWLHAIRGVDGVIYRITFLSPGEPAVSFIGHLQDIGVRFNLYLLSANGPSGYIFKDGEKLYATNIDELNAIRKIVFQDDLVLFNVLTPYQAKIEMRAVAHYLFDLFNEVYRANQIPNLREEISKARIWFIHTPLHEEIRKINQVFLLDPEEIELTDIWELIISTIWIIDYYRTLEDVTEKCSIYSLFHHNLSRWLDQEFNNVQYRTNF